MSVIKGIVLMVSSEGFYFRANNTDWFIPTKGAHSIPVGAAIEITLDGTNIVQLRKLV